MSWKNSLLWIVLAAICVGAVSCGGDSITPDAAGSPLSPLASPLVTPTPAVSLPAGETLLDWWVGDLDADGRSDIVLVAAAAGQTKLYRGVWDGSVYTLAQEIPLPESGPLSQFFVMDLTGDGLQDVGVCVERPASDQFVLLTYVLGGELVLKSPVGGVLDGQTGFVSLAEPPVVGDVDEEGGIEIVVFVEGASPEYLAARPYYWDGSQFSFTTLLLLPGRVRP